MAHQSNHTVIRTLVGAALVLSTGFNASAHIPSEEKNKQQHDLLAPYAGFIMHMEKKDGLSCCGLEDGVGKVPEKRTDYPAVISEDGRLRAAPNGTRYHIKLTKDAQGKDLPNGGFWMDVPDEFLLNGPQYEKVKEKHKDDPTFKAPPFNIVWTNNNYPTAQDPSARPFIYCFWPAPKIQ
jgi:hypothetical protein